MKRGAVEAGPWKRCCGSFAYLIEEELDNLPGREDSLPQRRSPLQLRQPDEHSQRGEDAADAVKALGRRAKGALGEAREEARAQILGVGHLWGVGCGMRMSCGMVAVGKMGVELTCTSA